MTTPKFDLTTKAGIGKAMTYLAAECSSDPLRFVQVAFPWGKDSLEGMAGPDKWQTSILTDMRDKLQSGEAWEHVMQYAVAAGHGVGKSGLVAWIILWGLCTFPDTRIVVTANTENQLRTKTFAEVAKWHTSASSRIGSQCRLCPLHASSRATIRHGVLTLSRGQRLSLKASPACITRSAASS